MPVSLTARDACRRPPSLSTQIFLHLHHTMCMRERDELKKKGIFKREREKFPLERSGRRNTAREALEKKTGEINPMEKERECV